MQERYLNEITQKQAIGCIAKHLDVYDVETGQRISIRLDLYPLKQNFSNAYHELDYKLKFADYKKKLFIKFWK